MDNDRYIGKLLDDRYEILEVIGNGGMAVVYKARCRRLNRMVAIKILKDEYSQDKEFLDRFHAESQAVAMLSHPNIVSVYDVSSSADADYIVMELIEGITLKYYMEKKGVLNWKETLHFAIQIAKALEHAHSRGIVHRDIKPHNVMVLKNGSVKVADFGIAQMMSTGDTMAQEALGSVHYISPEQAKGSRVDSRSDVYSLGVVMYEMISGRVPYDGENPVAVVMQHINGQMQLPSALNPNTPKGLEQIILKAMARQPKDRYPTATAMLYDMDEFRKNPTMTFAPVPPVVKENPVDQDKNGGQTIAQKKTAAPVKKKAPDKKVAPKSEGQNRSRVATIAITSCVLAALVAVVIVVLLLPSCQRESNEVKVPNLLGMTEEELQALTDIRILILRDYNEEYPEGQVFAQNPAGGTVVEKGYTVSVSVSRGSGVVRMPDVLGMSVEEAREALDQLGLGLEKVTKPMPERDDSIPVSSVVRTEPGASEPLEIGQTVTIYYNPTTKKVPEVEGKTVEQAIDALEAAGFYDYEVTYKSSQQELGTVLKVSPTGNQGTDQVIKLEVSAGTLKDLSKESLEDAKKYLDELNETMKLSIKYTPVPESSSVIEENTVIRTDPAAGSVLSKGMEIKVYYSSGSKMVEVPDLRGMTAEQAKTELTALGFVNPVERKVTSPLTEGAVVGLSAQIGVQVDVSKTIYVYVSSGTGLDNLQGKTLEEAEKYLYSLNLNLTVDAVPVKSDAVEQGGVISTDPGAKQTVKFGQKVTVYFSSGPANAVVPDVEGKTLEEARNALYAAGFYKLRVEYMGADVAPGTVLVLSETAGTTVATDKEILILVAQGEVMDEDVVLSNYAFELPGHDEAVEVSIYCDDTLVLTEKVPADVNVVTHTISGRGAKQYHIYINGDYCNTETVVFEANE